MTRLALGMLGLMYILNGCGSAHNSRAPEAEEHAMPQLTVLYFDGCPNTPPVLQAAEEAVSRLGEGWGMQTVDLNDLPETDLRRGYGSPTILLNGRDLFGASAPTTALLSCRYYPHGVPDADTIVRAILDHSSAHTPTAHKEEG